jgi:hypothetical protein
MPWRIKRLLLLYGFGFGALILGIIVVARGRTIDSILLGLVAVLGGMAIVLNTLPTNGHQSDYRNDRPPYDHDDEE